MILAIAAAVVLAGAIFALIAMRAVRRPVSVPAAPAIEWTSVAGDEFAGLSEPARCELIFAIAALDDQQALPVLERALGDPSETVALAAAHALASRGHAAIVEGYLQANAGERASRIADTLALLETPGITPR